MKEKKNKTKQNEIKKRKNVKNVKTEEEQLN